MTEPIDNLEELVEAAAAEPRDPSKVHNRFHRKVWAVPSDFTGALAKALVRCSPYTVPDKLAICIEKFHTEIIKKYPFDSQDMCEIELLGLSHDINEILETIPEVMALNERKNGRGGIGFSSWQCSPVAADDDFIAIMALAQNITCEFADEADVREHLDECSNRQDKYGGEGGGCTLAGPGRGDCGHFLGLPGASIPNQHDGPDDTVDPYGKPNGWCWSCWKSHEIQRLESLLSSALPSVKGYTMLNGEGVPILGLARPSVSEVWDAAELVDLGMGYHVSRDVPNERIKIVQVELRAIE